MNYLPSLIFGNGKGNVKENDQEINVVTPIDDDNEARNNNVLNLRERYSDRVRSNPLARRNVRSLSNRSTSNDQEVSVSSTPSTEQNDERVDQDDLFSIPQLHPAIEIQDFHYTNTSAKCVSLRRKNPVPIGGYHHKKSSSSKNKKVAATTDEEIETPVVDKTRDGFPLFEALHQLHLQKNMAYKPMEVQPLTSDEEEVISVLKPSLSTTLAPSSSIMPPSNQRDFEYFTKLHEFWNVISRADMIASSSSPPSASLVSTIMLRDYGDNSAFTQLYPDTDELDLRRRPLDSSGKVYYSLGDIPRRSLKTATESQIFINHFQNFIKSHDANINRLQNLANGGGPNDQQLPLHTDPEPFLSRFQKYELRMILRQRRQPADQKNPVKKTIDEDFRWDSQLSSSLLKKRKPGLEQFYQSHDQNVLEFQALLDDPLKCASSRHSRLDRKVYHKILDSDIAFYHANQVVQEVEDLLMEMIPICRDMYIMEKFFPLLTDNSAVLVMGNQLMLVPEYAESKSFEAFSFPSASYQMNRNEWVLTDGKGKPIIPPSDRERSRIPLSTISSLSSSSSSSSSSLSGVISSDQAILLAFLERFRPRTRLLILPNDNCTVHIDREKNVITVRCERWGEYISEKTIPLPNPLRLRLQSNENLHFYFKYQPLDQNSKFLQQKQAIDQIKHRWIWRDYPFLRVNYSDLPIAVFEKFPQLDAFFTKPEKAFRFIQKSLSSYFQKSGSLRLQKLFWYPASRETFSSDYEEAAHHICYNRLEKLKILFKKNNSHDLVKRIQNTKAGESLLEIAVKMNRVEIAKFLIQSGADVNRINQWGNTALILALAKRLEDMSIMLIECGAQSIPNSTKKSPLLFACHWPILSVIRLLIRRGDSWDFPDKNGDTPLNTLAGHLYSIYKEKDLLFPLLEKKGFREADIQQLSQALQTQNETDKETTLHYLNRLLEYNSLSEISNFTLITPLNGVTIHHLGSIFLHEKLKKIIFSCPLNDQDLDILTGYLLQQQKLESLSLYSIPPQRIVSSLQGIFPTLTEKVGYTSVGVTAVSRLLQSPCDLVELYLHCDGPGLAPLAQGIGASHTLQTLALNIFETIEDTDLTHLTNSLLVNKSLLHLTLSVKQLTIDQWTLLFDTLQQCPTLQTLAIQFTSPDYSRSNSTNLEQEHTSLGHILAQYLQSNVTLRVLTACGINYQSRVIAQALRENPLNNLDNLNGINLNTKAARKVLGLDTFFRSKDNKTILRYLKEMKNKGAITVKRVKLIFAGNGEVGKSTLIRRLKEGKFEENSQIMTDGVDISYFKIEDVEVSVYDFAGQPEYEHTHSLFFDQNSIYLLLYSPRSGGMERLKIYQQMILNCVPNAIILFITTRADEARLTQDELENILEACPNIIATIPVDSKSGTGIEDLKSLLVSVALKKEQTVKTIPASFERLRQHLQLMGSQRFSVSAEEIRLLCTSQLSIKSEMIELALELFLSWGYIFRLSNGDYVLEPQQLADVLACVFSKLESTKSRIGDVKEGVLRHTNDVLDAVWMAKFPTLSKSLWRCSSEGVDSPFLSLLYQAGLAFPLYDSKSNPIGASLVPGLLPLHPCGFHSLPTNSKAPYQEKLCQLFVPSSLVTKIHPRVAIHFKDALPTAFIGRLQVKLRRMATLGGAWKKGCCLVLQDLDLTTNNSKIDTTSGPQKTDQVTVKSLIIIYQSRDEVIEFISAGDDTSARSTSLSIMMSLIEQQFPCVSIESVKLHSPLREYGPHDLLENFSQGYIAHSNEKIHIGSLRILEPALRQALNLPMEFSQINATSPSLDLQPNIGSNPNLNLNIDANTDSYLSFLMDSNPHLQRCPPGIIKRFKELEYTVSAVEGHVDESDDGDFVFVSEKLNACIPSILQIMGLRHSKRGGLSTLWLILGAKGGQTIGVPLSPTRAQGNVMWYPLLEEGKTEIEQISENSQFDWEDWLAKSSAALIERTLRLLEVPITKRWTIKPYLNLAHMNENFKQIELRYFQDLDGTMLMEKFFQAAKGMLMSKQIHKLDDRSQAQERVLIKVVQQNEETIQILRRVEEVVVGISEGMKIGFSAIRQELSLTNQEGLEEIKQLWNKKMEELEKTVLSGIEAGGVDNSKMIEKQMNKLEVMFTAKLFDLDINPEGIKAELQAIQKQLIETNEARLRGETAADQKLTLILTEMKQLQIQLDRVEQMTIRIFNSMETGFSDIRQELITTSNSEGMKELKEVWLRKIHDLEQTLMTSLTPDAIEKQMKKMEMMINAKLVDLDLTMSSLTPQLNDVRRELQAVLVGVQQGEESSIKRLNEMMIELKSLQTELIEVIRLQKENSQNLNEGLAMLKNCIVNINTRVCPTTFIILPIPKQDNEREKKNVLRHLSSIHQAITRPKETLMSLLQDKYYLILICEVCRQPPDDQHLWYVIEKPKEIVGKILPLARAGLQFASALNKISSLGRIFGLPTPVLNDSTFVEGIEFMNELESGTLSDYSTLEKIVQDHYFDGSSGNGGSGGGGVGREKSPGSVAGATAGAGAGAGVGAGEMGYCIREFNLFLMKVDENKRWANLSTRVNERGDLCFVCPRCLLESNPENHSSSR